MLGVGISCIFRYLSERLHLPPERLEQLAKFVLVGSAGVIVNTGALAVFYEWARLPLLVASALAVEVAIFHNYLWNDRWTFGQPFLSLVRFAKFNLVSLGGLLITTSTLYGLVRAAGVHYLVANLVGIALATMWNFSLSLFWTWGGEGR